MYFQKKKSLKQSVHSYRKPIEIAHFFNYKHITHPYNFRENLVFDIPLIRSVRLSCSPIFSFPFTFNHFPENFKEIMERKDFMEKLDLFYISKFPNLNCNKNPCKFCHYFEFKKRQLQFALDYSRILSYHKYQSLLYKYVSLLPSLLVFYCVSTWCLPHSYVHIAQQRTIDHFSYCYHYKIVEIHHSFKNQKVKIFKSSLQIC